MNRKLKQALALLLALCVMLGLYPGGLPTASATAEVTYQEAKWNTTTKTVDYTSKSVTSYNVVTSGSTAWTDGWYVVDSNVTIDGRVTVTGSVNLILVDGITLIAKAGITVISGNSLTIYGQSGGTGALTVTEGTQYSAGIGGGSNPRHCGTITINGGKITVESAGDDEILKGAGIGGGYNGTGGTIIIYGGVVTANGTNGAGIGGGRWEGISDITIYGGTIVVTGSSDNAGIGNGAYGKGGKITVNGGKVTAYGGNSATGIGGGYQSTVGEIAINGGEVTATGGVADTYNNWPAANAIGDGPNADQADNFVSCLEFPQNAKFQQ